MSNGSLMAVNVLGRLRSFTELTVLDSVTLDSADQVPTGPYVIYWDADDLLFSDRLDGIPNRLGWGCYLICGGRRVDQLRWTVDFVRGGLRGWWFGDDEGTLTEVPTGAPEIEDATISSDVRNTKTLEYRITIDWS